MGLNIKNERVHALAREAARRSGKTQTSAIEEALELMLDRLRATDQEADRRERLRGLIAEATTDRGPRDPHVARQIQDDLYDERGLPR